MSEQTPVAQTALRHDPLAGAIDVDLAVLCEWYAAPAPPPAVPPEEIAVLAEWVAVASPVPHVPPAARFEVDPALLNEWSAAPVAPPEGAVVAARSAALAEAAATIAPPAREVAGDAGVTGGTGDPEVLDEWAAWVAPAGPAHPDGREPAGSQAADPAPLDEWAASLAPAPPPAPADAGAGAAAAQAPVFDPDAFEAWCAGLTVPAPPPAEAGGVAAGEAEGLPGAAVEDVPGADAAETPEAAVEETPEARVEDLPAPAAVAAPTGPVVVGAFEVAGLAAGPGDLAFAGVSFLRRLAHEPRPGSLRIEMAQSRNVAPSGVSMVLDSGFAPDREGCTLVVAAAGAGPFVASGHLVLDDGAAGA